MNKKIFEKKKNPLKVLLIILIAFILIFSAASFIIVKVNFDDVFGRTTLDPLSYYLMYTLSLIHI